MGVLNKKNRATSKDNAVIGEITTCPEADAEKIESLKLVSPAFHIQRPGPAGKAIARVA